MKPGALVRLPVGRPRNLPRIESRWASSVGLYASAATLIAQQVDGESPAYGNVGQIASVKQVTSARTVTGVGWWRRPKR